MKRFKLLFQIGDRKLKMTIYAENDLDARTKLFKAVQIHRVQEVPILDDFFKDIFGPNNPFNRKP